MTRFFNSDTGGGGGSAPATGTGAAPAAASASAAGGSTLIAGGGGQSVAAPAGAPPTAAPASWSWAKEDGALSEGWLEKLDGDLKGNPSLRSIGTLQDLAKSYVETKKLIGTKLEAPGENATPEQVAAWRKTLGAPEKPEGYLGDAKSLRPDTFPENLWNVESEKGFLALAHKHHLPPSAVKDIIAFHAADISKGLQTSQGKEQAVLKQEGEKLRGAWGQEYDTNLNLAARMAQTVGLDPSTHPIFTNSDVVQAFAKMGRLISEDKLVKGEFNGISGAIGDRVRDITDAKSQSALARDYRGEFGPQRQEAAQRQLHELMAAQGQK